MDLSNVITLFLNDLGAIRSSLTVKTYRTGINHFSNYLSEHSDIKQNEPIPEFFADLFIPYPTALAGAGHSKSTRRVYLTAVENFWEFLIIADLINPSLRQASRFKDAVKRSLRYGQVRKPKIPVVGLAEQIVKAAKSDDLPSPIQERNYALLSLLYSSGLRAHEAAGLRCKAISNETGINRGQIVGKGSKDGDFIFSPTAAQAIKEYHTVRGYSDPDDPVFARHDNASGKDHKPITTQTVRDITERAFSLLDLPGNFTPHDFRHNFGSVILQASNNLALAQDLLRHASPNTTRIYAQNTAQAARDTHKDIFG